MAEIFQFLIKGRIKAYFKPFKANLRPISSHLRALRTGRQFVSTSGIVITMHVEHILGINTHCVKEAVL